LGLIVPAPAAEPRWRLPDARDVQLGGAIGEAYRRGAERLSQDPYRSAVFLRSDVSFETKRVFVNYSGDISGRFIEIASLTFAFSPRAEDRRLKPLAVARSSMTRHQGITLWNGPSLLLANTDRTRPALLAEVGKDGRLRLPQDREGDFRLAVVPRVEATEQELAASIKGGENVLLAPWDHVSKDAPAAFVFDLITMPTP